MNFKFTREWLDKHLTRGDDNSVGAGGTTLVDLQRKVEHLMVTPAALDGSPTQLGKVLRFVREQNSWTRSDLAVLADIDENDITLLETSIEFNPSPRTVIHLANTCNFSRRKFMELARHRFPAAANESELKYAANSGSTNKVTDDDYVVICELVNVLSSRDD